MQYRFSWKKKKNKNGCFQPSSFLKEYILEKYIKETRLYHQLPPFHRKHWHRPSNLLSVTLSRNSIRKGIKKTENDHFKLRSNWASKAITRKWQSFPDILKSLLPLLTWKNNVNSKEEIRLEHKAIKVQKRLIKINITYIEKNELSLRYIWYCNKPFWFHGQQNVYFTLRRKNYEQPNITSKNPFIGSMKNFKPDSLIQDCQS